MTATHKPSQVIDFVNFFRLVNEDVDDIFSTETVLDVAFHPMIPSSYRHLGLRRQVQTHSSVNSLVSLITDIQLCCYSGET